MSYPPQAAPKHGALNASSQRVDVIWGLRFILLRKQALSQQSKKQMIRTHHRLETGSDHIGLVRMTGLEPVRPWATSTSS